jgi:carboxymethylenebutenolidase
VGRTPQKEFETKDVEATLETMVEDAYVNHMPVHTGGRGKDALRVFYRDDFIPSWPDDLQMTPVNRVVGEGQLVMNCTSRSPTVRQCPGFCPMSPNAQKSRGGYCRRRTVSRRQTRL